jgi:hypothetical protein
MRSVFIAIVFVFTTIFSFAQGSGSGISGFVYDDGGKAI